MNCTFFIDDTKSEGIKWKFLSFEYLLETSRLSVRLSFCPCFTLCVFQILHFYHKMWRIKVTWYVRAVSEKNALLFTLTPLLNVHENIRQDETQLRLLKLTSVFHLLSGGSPKQLCALPHLGGECFLVKYQCKDQGVPRRHCNMND